MDESSPVYENFSNKMIAMSGRPKLNVTNMKSPFSGGGSIVPKMALVLNLFQDPLVEVELLYHQKD